ncbi:Ribosome association toxin RatA [Candidatus Erwinia haradaeae]|uniref:Ribosome association toxin RatA, partial n=1 Tax=Candidatus Erwinia haradaeae TaxID=1922217 RepID=A0A451CZV8_9GAMM|nr:SRPBCC family protein [Candidatus Erwinia haradaeae]VFP78914.1 Ribosome association toxin RatA [Candidatus Erwinia haradaeae]
MSNIICSSWVPFSSKKMYILVNDIECYPQFLSGCISSRIINCNSSQMTASMDIEKSGIKMTIITRNTLVSNKSIHMQLLEGPFSQLSGSWYFIPISENSCQVRLILNLKFTDRLIAITFKNLFQKINKKIIYSFIYRAKKIYDNKNYG